MNNFNEFTIKIVGGLFVLSIGGLIIKDCYKYIENKFTKRHERLSSFEMIKTFVKYNYKSNVNKFIGCFIGLEVINFVLKNSFKWHFCGLLIATPLTVFIKYCYNEHTVEKVQNNLSIHYPNHDIKVIDWTDRTIKVVSAKPLSDADKPQLGLIFKTNVNMVQRDNNFYLIKYTNETNKYLDLDNGSLARLEQILIDLKAKPNYIDMVENEIELVYRFTTQLNPKMYNRHLENITHKLGIKKGLLMIENENGYNYFHVNKGNKRMYCLDEILSRIKVKTEEIPFVVGVNPENGTPLLYDLMLCPHIGIFGKSRSGKSTTFVSLINSIMYLSKGKNLFYMLDFEEVELTRYRDFNNVKWVDSDKDSVISMLDELLVTMDDRKAMFTAAKVVKIKEYNAKYENIPYITVCIDEANGFRDELNVKNGDDIYRKMYRIMRAGAKYGINVIMAAQQSNDTNFVKSWKTQMAIGMHLLTVKADVCNVTTNQDLQKKVPLLQQGQFIFEHQGKVYNLQGCVCNNDSEVFINLEEEFSNEKIDMEIEKIDMEIEIEEKAAGNN